MTAYYNDIDPFVCDWLEALIGEGLIAPGMATEGINPDGSKRLRVDMLPRQAHGVIADSSSAESPPAKGASRSSTEGRPLNPRFSLWLMGYPVAWACCGEPETQSCRKSRRSS